MSWLTIIISRARTNSFIHSTKQSQMQSSMILDDLEEIVKDKALSLEIYAIVSINIYS